MSDPAATNHIITERLHLRPFEPGDLDAFVAYRSDPEVSRYQSWDSTFSLLDAQRFLRSQQGLEFGRPGPWMQLAAVERQSGTLLGDCAVRVLKNQRATAEIGVTLAPGSQRRGIGSEAVTAVLRVLFEEHQIHRIYAQTDDRNVAAQRLLDRLGLRREARLVEADWCKGEWTTIRPTPSCAANGRRERETGA
jgi:aminoglycoside 6'-N-acetyltransferase